MSNDLKMDITAALCGIALGLTCFIQVLMS